MKKLKEELFINAEEVYGKEVIDLLRQKIYDIGWAIISDDYLVDKKSESKDKEWDYIEK